MNYSELLRDPRWQRKRLDVMQSAGWKCERCGDMATTLNVHHKRYVSGRKPWEYGRSDLECLCEPCHAKEHGIATEPERAEPQREPLSPELEAIAARLREIDRLIPVAGSEERDALICEKFDLAKEWKAKRRPTWRSSP